MKHGITGFTVATLFSMILLDLLAPHNINFPSYFPSLMALLAVSLLAFALNKIRKQKDELDYKTTHEFDYKFFCLTGDESFTNIYNTFFRLKNEEDKEPWDDQADYIKSVWYINRNDIPSPEDIFDKDNYNKTTRCRAITKYDTKQGKCFFQCSFIPVDKNGNTILIERLAKNHQTSKVNSKKRQFAFISFSPISNHFMAHFDSLECYHREVPISSLEPQIIKLGFMLRHFIEGKEKRFFMFFVFLAYYKDISFTKVSAQPAPSGFEADSVVCSVTNRNNGRTAWDVKDEIIGRRNCQNIGTAV